MKITQNPPLVFLFGPPTPHKASFTRHTLHTDLSYISSLLLQSCFVTHTCSPIAHTHTHHRLRGRVHRRWSLFAPCQVRIYTPSISLPLRIPNLSPSPTLCAFLRLSLRRWSVQQEAALSVFNYALQLHIPEDNSRTIVFRDGTLRQSPAVEGLHIVLDHMHIVLRHLHSIT